MLIKKVLILISIFLLLSCSLFYTGNKINFYICSNIEYNKLFDDYKNLEYFLIKYFNRHFYNVKIRKITTFSGFLQEFSDIGNKDKNSIIFVHDFLSQHIIENKDLFANNKIITYNNREINKDLLSIFNIYLDSNIIANSLIKIIDREKKKFDYSDVLIVVNSNYQTSKEVIEIIKSKNSKITFLEETLDYNIKKYLEEEKYKFNVVVFFGYNLNKVLVDIYKDNNEKENKEKLLNIKYIEIFSNYLQGLNLNGYSLNLNIENLIKSGINSKEFFQFLRQKGTKSYDYKISKNYRIIEISKKIRISPFFNKRGKDQTSDSN